jgi:hypothetical protein
MKPAQRQSVTGLSILPDNGCDPQDLNGLIGDIYDTVLDPSLWVGVLERTAHFVRGTGAALYSKDVANQEGSVQYVVGIDPYYTQLYFEKYVTLDPTTTGHFLADIEQPVATADLWNQVSEGEGRVVLLTGEPGVGKSRLIAALHERLQSQAHVRIRYFCSQQHTDSALYPVINQLERAARFERGDEPAQKLLKLQTLLAPAVSKQTAEVPLLADLRSIPREQLWWK